MPIADATHPRFVDDPESFARLLSDVQVAVLRGERTTFKPRPLISESWQRSIAAKVDPEASPAFVHDPAYMADIQRAHPLAPILPMLQERLLTIADSVRHIALVTDADGLVLWCDGATDVRRNAETIGLVEGRRWSEGAIGTNGVGTALAVAQSVQIHSAEHLVRRNHAWTCAASPIRDPDTGELLGAIDVSGPFQTIHPSTLALVEATSMLAEAHLRFDLAMRDEQLRARNVRHLEALGGLPGAILTETGRVIARHNLGELPERLPLDRERLLLGDGREATVEPLDDAYLVRVVGDRITRTRPTMTLSFLGVPLPTAELGGHELPLTERHAEILALLALNPTGLTSEQLALQLYGERGSVVTTRAEIHRLRGQVGSRVVETKPYRLAADVNADFLTVRDAVAAGDVLQAAASYRGSLLPRSEAPGIRAERDELYTAVRGLVLSCGSPRELAAVAATDSGRDDVGLVEALVDRLPVGSMHRARWEARLRRILADE